MIITDCFGAQQWSLEDFELLFLQFGWKFLIAALQIAFLIVCELQRKQPNNHQRQSVLKINDC